MKKLIAVLTAVILSAGLFCASAQGAYTQPVQIEGAIFGGRSDDSISAEVTFDPAWITDADNTVYNADLAAFAALISADSYFREKDLAKGTQNRVLIPGAEEEYDWTCLLKAAGFTDARHIESFREREYSADSNDSVTLTLGYLDFDGRYDCYAVVFRGCFSAQEWLSVYDPGSDSPAYEALTGEHPEWTDKNRYKGLDIAANRAVEFISEFMQAHDRPELPDCILFTGHSRGGSLANMIGADFEKNSAAKTFTYTFSTMPVTADADAGARQTVFNLYDSGDFFTDALPFGEEHFSRYGRDLCVRIADSPEIRAAVAAMKCRDDYACPPAEITQAYAEMFGRRFPDRAALYEMKTAVQVFDTEEAALARRETCLGLIGAEAGLDLGQFCGMGEVSRNDEGKFELEMEYCDAALIWGFSKILAYGDAAYEAFRTLFEADADGCAIAELLITNLQAINAGHLIINSYILTGYVK